MRLHPKPLVLVVDDNHVNRLVASALVECLGCYARTACDGMQAIHLCETEMPAAVLMDLEMPRLNGIEATRMLRELQRVGGMAPCRVIAVTADATEQTRNNALAVGMDSVLLKPLKLHDLQIELRRLVAGRAH
jgi:CheY-like chemotaxis protein